MLISNLPNSVDNWLHRMNLFDGLLVCRMHYVQGGRLFTSSGTLYYHGFNLTLCNTKNTDLPVCINNVTTDSQVRRML